MKLADFDFDLPNERIALRPAEPRDSARMLVVKSGRVQDAVVSALTDWLRPGDVMVFNDTRVIPARLRGKREADGVRGETSIEVTLHLREGPDRWRAFAKPSKRLRAGDVIVFDRLNASVIEKADAGEIVLDFDQSEAALDAAIAMIGEMPLPPYIAGRRPTDARDLEDYQTLYARRDGAVAAPTAGLHFTESLLAAIDEMGVRRATVTLHVGAGTFLPVKVDNVADHKMHAEWGEISAETAETINAARASGGRIVSVGTTSLRLLESAADEKGMIQPFQRATDIFITPGYRFKAVDVLMTNFHLPRSTLFMLVSAFAGEATMKAAYRHAIDEKYRFYSYGDASLLFPKAG
ncbi:MAG: tRNA preQ1(34) S-adenosylmethionine ribosyltransferase-isomerase QueA [Proteobacteria bacterium]|nr:tRNA preQ1(34) S-adenosylmethionine ribosyltransferase-isomerase QueA [Pseudomonadota bacterium]